MIDAATILHNIPGIRAEASAEVRSNLAAVRQVIANTQRETDERMDAMLHAYIATHEGDYKEACESLRSMIYEHETEFGDRLDDSTDDDAYNDPCRGQAADLNARRA